MSISQGFQGLSIQNIAVLENLLLRKSRISRRQIKTLAQFWNVHLSAIYSWLKMRHRMLSVAAITKERPRYALAGGSLFLFSANRTAGADVNIVPDRPAPDLDSTSSSPKMRIGYLLN
ncbi:hypothetical protein H4R99_002229 [Coemansia sp. RSA 1722]|nr:hypothetical protein IWW45_006307 [Coemansia sp. RSA 485]KAJ2603770.1 hypothetical protein H4R99_002229 [Coemansia sp. RSA 1722]